MGWMVLCGVLTAVAAALVCKIAVMKKSAQEIGASLAQKLADDTNTLITVSTRDKDMCALANNLNRELRLLRQERHRYQQGDRELKEAVTNISHDLRTPLTAICGYLDLLEREEKSEAVQRYLSQIENRTEAMKSLTEELFRYSMVTSLPDLKPERLDMVLVLEESLLSFYGVMQEKGIQPQICLPEEPIYRELDAGALNRIFANIISNAVKYSDGDFSVIMQADGGVTFSNSAKELDNIAVGRFFDRFYTVEASRNSTGLGLSIAKLLTERMGGTIKAEYRDERLYIRIFWEEIS